jgi:hypothetical protein
VFRRTHFQYEIQGKKRIDLPIRPPFFLHCKTGSGSNFPSQLAAATAYRPLSESQIKQEGGIRSTKIQFLLAPNDSLITFRDQISHNSISVAARRQRVQTLRFKVSDSKFAVVAAGVYDR